MGKGGGGGQPTQTSSNVTNTNVPEYARPYVENMLSATQSQLFKTDGNNITGFQPYKAYGGTYDEAGNQTAYDPSKAIAGFSPMQQQAMAMANGPEGFAQNVGGYMSPYMQNVVDIQKREAGRQSGIMGMQQQAQATQAGAFGGSRDAIQRAERERNLSQQMGDIQAQGSQAAFANAQNQFNTNLGQMNAAGAMQQQNQQQAINQSMQDYANAQQYPLMQLGTMSNMLRGLPMQAQTTQQYQAQANPITQGIGAIGSLGSLSQMKAEGGAVKSMASGGITSVPRYDVGGAVVSQLATMPDEALKKEAMESPSPRVREMAAAILKQRQAGMNAEPQAAEAPQGVGPMGVDYNANYAGGGIIAFATGEKVDAEKAARLAKQTEMYVAGAKLAAEQRAAEEQAKAAAQPASRGVPTLLDRNAPAYTGAERQPNETFEQFRQRTIQAQTPPSLSATELQDQTERERLTELAKRRETGQIPRVSPYIDATKLPDVGSARSKTLSQDEMRAMSNSANSSGIKPYVAPGSILSAAKPPPLLDKDAAPYSGPAIVPVEKRSLTAAPKVGPVVVKDAAPATVDRAPPALLDRNAPAYSGPSVEGAPTGITTAPAVDPLADARTTLKSLQDTANKSQEEIYKENLAAMKAQGLDTSEARQQYMKDQMAQRANIEKDAQNKEYLRRAQFFAQWGSTPGNTLVAGMAALKERIPDIIQDAADKRLALQQADKAIYELGEATRMEKLGQWEKAAAQKLEAAKTAATLQAHITQAAATIRGHEISKEGTLGAAGIRAASDEKGYASAEKIQGMRDVVDKLKIESDAATRRENARLAAQARHDAMTGRSEDKNNQLYLGAQTLQANVESRINNIMKSTEYEQLRQTASMPESSTNKSIIDSAKKALKAYDTSFATQRKAADDALQFYGSRAGVISNAATNSAPVIDPAAAAWVKDPKNANDPRLPAIKAKLGMQ
jgi:hypothetical protein